MSNDVYVRAAKHLDAAESVSAFYSLRCVRANQYSINTFEDTFPELFSWDHIPVDRQERRDIRVLALLFMSAAGGDL